MATDKSINIQQVKATEKLAETLAELDKQIAEIKASLAEIKAMLTRPAVSKFEAVNRQVERRGRQ